MDRVLLENNSFSLSIINWSNKLNALFQSSTAVHDYFGLNNFEMDKHVRKEKCALCKFTINNSVMLPMIL